MIIFLLPHSKKQSKIYLKDCLGKSPPPAIANVDRGQNLLPLWRLLKGPFWESLDLPALPPSVREFILNNSLVLSPVFGLISPKECVYYHPFGYKELKESLSSIKIIAKNRLNGAKIFLFCSSFEASLIKSVKASQIFEFRFRKAGNLLKDRRRYLAYCLRYIAEYCPDLSCLERINFLDYKVESIHSEGFKTTILLSSPGRYEI
ncbi:MAG: hypothetical protein NZL90_03050 [Aquificaceae bacterium]|nr:hypothetical protein [Aquificaceae bacterium]MDW8237638.1 hypothetical protein [Aquificaceae bacterium]